MLCVSYFRLLCVVYLMHACVIAPSFGHRLKRQAYNVSQLDYGAYGNPPSQRANITNFPARVDYTGPRQNQNFAYGNPDSQRVNVTNRPINYTEPRQNQNFAYGNPDSQRANVTNRPANVNYTASRQNLPEPGNRDRLSQVCGINIEFATFVVNGTKTTIGEFPWLVAMFYYEKGDYDYRCAGTLVTNRHLITAAHCFKNKAGIEILAKNVALVLGKSNIDNWIAQSEVRGVEKYVIHPDYGTSSDGDLAVVRMDATVTFGNTIKPICLWSEGEDLEDLVGDHGTVAGWGRDETGANHVSEPRKLSMPVISQEDCLRSDERFFRITSKRTFCAGYRNGSIPCTGDSGSGFIMKRNGRWWLRGVVSGGLVRSDTRHCDSRHYVVFVDVAKFKPWLINNLDGTLALDNF